MFEQVSRYIDPLDFENLGYRRSHNVTVGTWETLCHVLHNGDVADVLHKPVANVPNSAFWYRVPSLEMAAKLFGSSVARFWVEEGRKTSLMIIVARAKVCIGPGQDQGDSPGPLVSLERKCAVLVIRVLGSYSYVCYPDESRVRQSVIIYEGNGIIIKGRVTKGWVLNDNLVYGAKYERPHLCWRVKNGNLWCKFRVGSITPEGVLCSID